MEPRPDSATLTLEMISVPPGFIAALRGDLTWESAAAIETFFLLEASLQPAWAILDISGMDVVHADALECLARLARAFADVGSRLEVRGAS